MAQKLSEMSPREMGHFMTSRQPPARPQMPTHDPEYETKVDYAVDMMQGMSMAEQAYMISVVPFTDPLNATRFMASKGVRMGGMTSEETKKSVPAIYEAIDRFSANLKLSNPIKWLAMASMIGKVTLEFRGAPGKRIATRFAARELMTMPTKYESDMSWEEYAQMKGLKTAESAMVGATIGIVSKYVPEARYRIPVLVSGYMSFTGIKGGTDQQVLESGITVIGFSTLSILEKSGMKLAIRTARRNNPTLRYCTDVEVAKVIKGVKSDGARIGKGRFQKAINAVKARMKPVDRAVEEGIKKAGISPKEMRAEPREVAVTQKQVRGIAGLTKEGFARSKMARLQWLSRNASKLDAKYTTKMEAALKKGDVAAVDALSAQWEADLLEMKAPKPVLRPPVVARAKEIAKQPDAIEAREEALARGEKGLEKFRAVVKPDITKPNPYRHMPIEQVREDARNGVKLAKEVLAVLEPESVLGTKATIPSTLKQKRVAHQLKDKHHLTDDQYRRVLKYTTGQGSMAKLSVEEADDAIRMLNNFNSMIGPTKEAAKTKVILIDPLMPKGYNAKIRKTARSDETFNKAIIYSNKAGGVPSNKNIPGLAWRQQRYAQDIVNVASIQRRVARKGAVREEVGRQYNLINPWSSARYALAQAGVKSGVPLRRMYSNIVASANKVRSQNSKALNDALRRAGAPRFGSPLTFKDGVKISNWLFTNGEEQPDVKMKFWNAMTPKTQKIAAEVHGFLQNESAFQVRWARWIKWDRAAKRADNTIRKLQDRGVKLTKTRLNTIMKPVKNARPPNAPKDALEEGRAAESVGQLLDWLGTQTWGTRKHYYMSEQELKDLTSIYPTGTIPEALEKMAGMIGSAPERVLPETMTREGKAKIARGGSLLSAVLNHANRVGTFAATYDDLQNFWTAFASTNPSPQDIGRARMLVNTSLGFRHSVEPWVRIARGMNVWFWRPYFAFSPKRSAWFAYRNLHQNIAYGLSQGELKEAAKSSKAITKLLAGTRRGEGLARGMDKINPWMREDYAKHWESRISQRRQIYHQFILQKQGAIVSDFGNRAVAIIDTLGSAPVYSDEVNRLQAWPIMHQTAYRNAQQLITGKISAKKFWTNLNMDTLHVDQRVEMHRLMDTGKWRELTNNYAEYKTENIHFRYETALRSVSEQTPSGRAVLGLKVFPWGTGEIMYQNGIKPFIQGYESGNYRQSYEGLKTITMGIFGSRMARGLLYAVTGRTAYGIADTVLRYTPVAPGPARLQEMFDVVSETMYRAQENDYSIGKTADTIMAATTYQSELFIPFCDVALDFYESSNDVYGVRLYSLLKKKARKRFYDETGKEFRAASRDSLEALQHAFWGGAEEGKELKLEGEGKVRRKVP